MVKKDPVGWETYTIEAPRDGAQQYGNLHGQTGMRPIEAPLGDEARRSTCQG